MGKLGVGVGDDFPIDEGKQPETQTPEARAEYERQREAWRQEREDWKKRREEWRKRREEWREKRRQWREEYRRGRDQFRAEIHARYGDRYDDYIYGGRHRHWRWPSTTLIVVLVGAIALALLTVNVVFNHIYLLFGLLVLAGLYFAYRGGFDHLDLNDWREPPRSPPPAQPTS